MDVATLKHLRGVAKRSLTLDLQYVDTLDPVQTSLITIKNRRVLVEQHFKKFDELQHQIEEQLQDNEEDFDLQVQVRDEVESRFLNIISKLDEAIAILTPPTHSATPTPTTIPSCSHQGASVKLPRLDLPKFSGRYDEWTPFKDLFESTIHSNASLSDVQKLQYLLSLVQGEAALVIRNLPITSTNYNEAWTLLKNRYDNKREIVYSLVRRLFNIQPIKTASASSIQQVMDATQECVRALTVLQLPTEHWDTLIVYMTVDRLDNETKKQWALKLQGTDLPTFKDLCAFLEQYVRSLNACASTLQNSDKKTAMTHYSTSSNPSTTKCVLCKSDHALFKCQKFLDKSVQDRIEVVRRYQLCSNCLRQNHRTVDCRSSSKCKTCNRHHNTLIHQTKPESSSGVTKASGEISSNHSESNTEILLSTALATVKANGISVDVRVLLDGGSQGTIISEDCVKALGLKREKDKTIIRGVGATIAGYSRGRVTCTLHSKVYDSSLNIEALILGSVTRSLPGKQMRSDWPHIQALKLADPSYSTPGAIDIILGNEYTMAIQEFGVIHGDGVKPYAQNTIFGWVVGGRAEVQSEKAVTVNHVECDTEKIMRKFWELEEVPKPKYYTAEEKYCEEHFQQTHKRLEDGRFCVKLPLKENIKQLGYSRDIAINRMKQVERRLNRFPHHKEEYINTMREAINLGHMTRVPRGEVTEVLGKTNYLSHHFVLKPESTTTKLRVVFDGSAKTSSGISLNDCLAVGATLQNDIFTLLIKFRVHQVAIKSDIVKMYKMFHVTEDDANLQRIVWRESPEHQVEDFKMTTVTFGMSSSNFLATRCLIQLGEEFKTKYPSAARKIQNEVYVDDLVGSCENTEEAKKTFQQLNEIASSGGLIFRKWSSNDKTFMNSISEELKETTPTTFEKDMGLKTLGVKWDSTTDNFCFGAIDMTVKGKLTKRKVLSQLARVFDPLGFVSPVTLNAKLFMQSLWKDNLSWDDPLNESLSAQWLRYCDQLLEIDQVTVQRWLKSPQCKNIELHGFADSSERAYGAVIYLRAENKDGSFSTQFIAAKSKVAPLKTQSLPRLELCGAVVLVDLFKAVKQAVEFDCQVFAWTDSMIVLQWLSSHPGRWETFIANRVAMIQEAVPFESWNHVKSEDNPADIVSRGMNASELKSCSLWWHGPQWLSTHQIPGKVVVRASAKSVQGERKNYGITVAHSTITTSSTFIDKFSSLSKLIRVMMVVNRFIQICRGGTQQRGSYHFAEATTAIKVLIKADQHEHYSLEISLLTKKLPLPVKSKLLQLNPFIDADGIMRVGGRLSKSSLPYSTRHQAILHHESKLAKLIIRDAHMNNLHGGTSLVWAYLRNRYWIVNGKKRVRMLIRTCVICRKARPEKMEQLMGALPTARVTPGRPFLHTGCDYAGPINLKMMKDGRGKKTFKGYFVVFVCMATKAVHLEPVSDMTTESFIQTLKRFVSRRGVPAALYSDCGTNFIGADNELKRLVRDEERNEEVKNQLLKSEINWNFNPPAAPHHGGLWEAAVKSVKYHLTRTIGIRTITFEELTTILCQVEACLNSRPLVALSSDEDNFDYLTPGHFLVGHPLTALPQEDLANMNINRLSRWEFTQQCFQQFWKRWRVEYLTSLQQRFKWKAKRENLVVGDLVVIHDENQPPLKWRTGRVSSVIEGADGLVRTATVKTSSGELKRPIVKLTPILYENEQH